MNLHALVSPLIQPINPSFVGTWMQSTGFTYAGDASGRASFDDTTMTVDLITSGALAVNSIISGVNIEPGTIVTAFGTGTGGQGTYTVRPPQTTQATAFMAATGDGTRTPSYTTVAGVIFQVQALSGRDLDHIDGLNLQGVVRAIYMTGFPQGLVRAAAQGGDLLLIPTGLTVASMDTWLVNGVIEQWNASGWTKVAAILQNPPPDQ